MVFPQLVAIAVDFPLREHCMTLMFHYIVMLSYFVAIRWYKHHFSIVIILIFCKRNHNVYAITMTSKCMSLLHIPCVPAMNKRG